MEQSAIRVIRRTLWPARRLAVRLLELLYLMQRQLGSAGWLIRSEVNYGGFVTNVAWRRVSPHGDRTTEEHLAFGNMVGGDRMSMLHHGYAPIYARYLAPFVSAKDLTVAEFGILKGTGLASGVISSRTRA